MLESGHDVAPGQTAALDATARGDLRAPERLRLPALRLLRPGAARWRDLPGVPRGLALPRPGEARGAHPRARLGLVEGGPLNARVRVTPAEVSGLCCALCVTVLLLLLGCRDLQAYAVGWLVGVIVFAATDNARDHRRRRP